ncbi:gamma-glutamylcyclotransferase [Streptomyces sp. UNOC14_S4]|nr:gamma-glutamylcyclotransferase [Streptomyces sp. UNOC14_S4]
MDHERLPVFVYGTLRPGQGNHERFLRGRTVAEEAARLRGAVLYEGPGYPYAVADPEGEIRGELVTPAPAAHDAVLASLDALEGYAPDDPSSHYVRVTRPVSSERGVTVRAWVYLASPEVADRLRRRGTRIHGDSWPSRPGP